MESSVQSMPPTTDIAPRSSNGHSPERLMAIRHEMEYLNTIGKRFVAAFDRFQVHRALLAALQEIYSFSACCILLQGDAFVLPPGPVPVMTEDKSDIVLLFAETDDDLGKRFPPVLRPV